MEMFCTFSAQRTEVVKAFQQMEGKVKNVVDEVRNFKSNVMAF